MMGKQLVAIELKKLPAGMHADGAGLYLEVKESGSRSWILRTMVRGKRKDIGLGGLLTTSLAEAREKAAQLRAKARAGEDIVETRRIEKRIIPTFKEAALTYHGQVRETFDSEQHAHNWLRSLEQYIFPAFGQKSVDAVDTADVLQAIGPIWNTVPDTARRTLRRVKAIFDYCQAAGYRNIMVGSLSIPLPNPCDIKTALPNNHGGEKHHGALPYQELPRFIHDLRKTNSSLSVKLAFEFLILTCARTAEVLNAAWDEFNLQDKVWSVPADRMKMKMAHKVPLSDRAIEILELAKQFSDGPIVFPSRPSTPLSKMSLLMALRRMGHDEITAHGFRATFKTWAEETTKFDSLVIEASMAHQVKGIERHYLRTTFLEQRRKLMNAWATYATASRTAKVVSIRA
jgi:integrase